MGLSPIISAGQGATLLASTSYYHPLINGGTLTSGETTESDTQVTWRTPGTLRNLWIVVTTNSRGASTLRSRINGANGNLSVTIPATTTGTFEDTTNSDAIADGDLLNTELAVGAGGASFIYTIQGALFIPTTTGNTLTKHGEVFQEVRTGGALTRYYEIQGGGSNGGSATEADVQYRIRTAGTWENLNVRVTANTRVGATTYRSRINTAYGNQSISVAAAATGVFEDTTNTDAVVATDLLDIEYVQAAGGGSLTTQSRSSELNCPNAGYHLIAGSSVFNTLGAGATSYVPISGPLSSTATESLTQTKLNIITALSNLFAYIVGNTVLATTTIRTRVGGANGNQSLSIGTLATGIFEDTTNSDILTAASIVNYQVVVGAGGTSITLTMIGVLGLAQAIVTTTAASNIGCTTADTGGNVTDGGSSVTARGVAYNTTGNPDIISDPFTTNGTGGGSFTSSLVGLSPGTTYFVRAYATNLAGTVYGNEISFTTDAVATVTTTAASNITTTTADTGGNVTADGGAAVTARGVAYNTTGNPDIISDPFTTDGAGLGVFVSNLVGLLPNTTYFVRSYATNACGTAYGNEEMFTTLSAGTSIVVACCCA